MKTILSVSQIGEAKRLRRQFFSYREIGRIMKVNCETVQRALDQKFAAKRALQIKTSKARIAALSDFVRISRTAVMPNFAPQEVIAERDRRINVPMSLTARIFGDPPPGYSALDQR